MYWMNQTPLLTIPPLFPLQLFNALCKPVPEDSLTFWTHMYKYESPIFYSSCLSGVLRSFLMKTSSPARLPEYSKPTERRKSCTSHLGVWLKPWTPIIWVLNQLGKRPSAREDFASMLQLNKDHLHFGQAPGELFQHLSKLFSSKLKTLEVNYHMPVE